MTEMIITEEMTTCKELHGQAIIYCKLGDQQYVIAKSVIKLLTEDAYICGVNPYIQKILESLPEDTVKLPVEGQHLLSKVWDNPGNKKDVYFVKALTLIDQLDSIFPQASPELLTLVCTTMSRHLETFES